MIYKIKTKDNKVYYIRKSIKDSKIKDIKYQFPELTTEDLRKATSYGLRLVKKLPDGDVILEGSMKQLQKYADEWLDYEFNKDYFIN